MRKFHNLIHSLLLTTTPAFFVPQYGHSSSQQINFQEIPYEYFNLTYDEVLCLLRDIEEGRIDDLSEEELKKSAASSLTLLKSACFLEKLPPVSI